MVAPAWNWAGFYIGGHVGGGAGNANFSDPFGGSIYGDNVSTPVFLAGGQITLTPNAGKYSTERWGTFLQASYKFDVFSAPAAVVIKY